MRSIHLSGKKEASLNLKKGRRIDQVLLAGPVQKGQSKYQRRLGCGRGKRRDRKRQFVGGHQRRTNPSMKRAAERGRRGLAGPENMSLKGGGALTKKVGLGYRIRINNNNYGGKRPGRLYLIHRNSGSGSLWSFLEHFVRRTWAPSSLRGPFHNQEYSKWSEGSREQEFVNVKTKKGKS